MAYPGNYDIKYYKGDTLNFNIYPKDSSGAQFLLTDFSAAFTIATARGSSATQYVATATISDDYTYIACQVAPSVGGQLSESVKYVYDVQISNTNTTPETVYTLLTGSITVKEQVTGAIL